MRYRLSAQNPIEYGGERTKTVSDGGPDVTKINSKLHFKFYVTAALGNLNASALRVMKFRPFCIQKGYLSTFYNTF